MIAHVRALLATWRGRFILAFVVAQLLLPLHYYVRRDPHDERFAWRMFSPMRMVRCAAKLAIDGKPLSLSSQFHEAWIEIAERGRFSVIEAMAAHECDEHPGSAVTVSLACTYIDGTSSTWGGHDMCETPRL